MKKQTFGKRDIIFLTGMACTGLLLTILIFCFSETGNKIHITKDGTLIGVYDLHTDQEIPIQSDGEIQNVVVIEQNKASMKEAFCPDHLCVHQGAISRSGQSIVCLPHRLVIEVYGTEKQTYDTVSQ
ncbi:MAG: NusG domain II-containing protein [Eubacterium sp.]|nr:NusG domain II-containing protein [Eubacterium sp.]